MHQGVLLSELAKQRCLGRNSSTSTIT
jgi:hypothetical protein